MPAFLSFDQNTQTFSFDKIEDSLVLSGETSTEYSVSLNYKVFSSYDPTNPSYDVDKELTWTVINPCTQPSIVTWNNPV